MYSCITDIVTFRNVLEEEVHINWCINKLTVKGPNLEAFVKDAEGFDRQYGIQRAEWLALMSRYKGKSGYADDKYELLCFNALIPVPNKVLMKGFDPQGYNWEMEHWGCKWGACDIKRRVLKTKVVYDFSTPNDPPLVLLDTVSSKYVELLFEMSWHDVNISRIGSGQWKAGTRINCEDRKMTQKEKRAIIKSGNF